MRRLAVVVLLTCLAGAAFAKAIPAHNKATTESNSDAPMAQVPGSEEAAYLQQLLEAVGNSGYKDPDVVPMFVVAATDANGKRVLLLVDPDTMQAVEVRDDPDVATNAHK